MDKGFLYDFVNILKNCSYDNTYKMAWAKALIEISLEKEDNSKHEDIIINLEEIARKVIKYYWNHTIFFDLTQGSNPNKPPMILTEVKALISHYQFIQNNLQPIRYERAITVLKLSNHYEKSIRKIVTILKQDVSYRFLILNKKMHDIYTYNKGDDSLIIKRHHLIALKESAYFLFDIVNYRWALILETFNSSPRIGKKVKIIDDQRPQRKTLSKYYEYIALDNPEKTCFICNKPIDEKPDIDHVIPWSYMYSDDLWNLVFVHKSCNSSKSNKIPSEHDIAILEERNKRLLVALDDRHIKNKDYQELVLAEKENFVRKFWIGCQ